MNTDMLNILAENLSSEVFISHLKELSLEKIVSMVVTVVFTVFGYSIKDIFKLFNKNGRAYRYALLSKVYHDNIKNYLKKIAVYTLELLMILLSTYVIIGIVEMYVFFAHIVQGDIVGKNVLAILILIIAGTIVAGAFMGKRGYLKIFERYKFYENIKSCKIVEPLIVVFGMDVLAVFMLALLLPQNYKMCLFVLAVISVSFVFAIITAFHRCSIYKNYKYPKKRIIEKLHYIILISYTAFYFLKSLISYEYISFWIWIWLLAWIMLSCLEYIFIFLNDDISTVKVTLYTKNGEKITKDKIVQYGENKIGYRLLDGKEEIIDDSEIEMITYQEEHYIRKGYKDKEKVECKLRNGNILHYGGVRLIRESWAELYKTEEGDKRSVNYKA